MPTSEQVGNLRGVFIAECEKARKERKIGVLEMIRCKRVWRNWDKPCPDDPDVTVGEAVADEISMQLVANAMVASPEEINWDAIAEFLQKILPLILEFIKMLLPLFAL